MALQVGNQSFQCRAAERNVEQGIDNLKKLTPGENCTFIRYNNPDPEMYDVGEFANSFSKCGYNEDSFAYCPIKLGDDVVINAREKVRKILTVPNPKCHSRSFSGSNRVPLCVSAFQEYKDVAILLSRNLINDSTLRISHLSANNDKCVAESIMKGYWLGTFGKKSF
jgi:hypothetical protein